MWHPTTTRCLADHLYCNPKRLYLTLPLGSAYFASKMGDPLKPTGVVGSGSGSRAEMGGITGGFMSEGKSHDSRQATHGRTVASKDESDEEGVFSLSGKPIMAYL